MRLLLDTHAFLWAIADDPRLSPRAREEFLDSDNLLFLGIVSAWEMAIKISLGKLEVAGRWNDVVQKEMRANGIAWLPVEYEHCVRVAGLPFHHRDPFDRLIAAQAQSERMSVMSGDPSFESYGVRRIW